MPKKLPPNPVEAGIVRYNARLTEGCPPALTPHPGYATFAEARRAHQDMLREHFPTVGPPTARMLAHDRWLRETFPEHYRAQPPGVQPDPPPDE